MATLNSVHLIGNITRDIELRYMPSGKAVADISLAINHKYTTDSGEKRESVTFVDVTLFGQTAEVCNEYCQKGSQLFVEGRLALESWDDKQTGQKRSKMKVVAEGIQLLGSKPSDGQRQESRQPPAQNQSRAQRPPKPPSDPDLDVSGPDIDF